MKKFFLLALVAGLALSAGAQTRYDKRKDAYDGRHNSTRYHKARQHHELQRRLDAINRDYDLQARYVSHDPHLRKGQKHRKIKQLEKERRLALERCRNQSSRKYRDGYAAGRRR